MSTRPSDTESSSRIGAPNVAPPSFEKAANARPLSSFPVIHATATMRPLAVTAGPFTGQAAICQPSSCTVAGGLHRPATVRATAMSRISVALRSRNATIGPSAVMATDVGQQSHTRSSTSDSDSCAPFRSNTAARRLMLSSPVPPLVSNARPSSQTRPSPAPGAWNSEANPCSVLVPS